MADEAEMLEAIMARRRAEMGIVVEDRPRPRPEREKLRVDPPVSRSTAALAQRTSPARPPAPRPSAPPVSPVRTIPRELVDSISFPQHADLRVIDLVHRGHDGYISLGRKDASGNIRDLGCVLGESLRGLFGQEWIETELQTDSYFCLHGMYRPNHYRYKTTLPQLEPSLRKIDKIKWLTTCHVDLDAYKVGIKGSMALWGVVEAASDGVIPWPSIISVSRGVWAWWLLRNDKGTGPVRAWPEVVDRWSNLQNALHQRLANLCSDRAALHCASYTRIPGSASSKDDNQTVAYLKCFDQSGEPFVYTMAELAAALGIDLDDRRRTAQVIEHRPDDRPKDPQRIELGKRGYRSRWRRFLEVLDHLRRMRGGWRVGHRSKALYMVAQACRARGIDTPPSLAEMAIHLEGMEQPVGDEIGERHLRAILKGAEKPKHGGITWQTVADFLDISPDESSVLQTLSRRIPPARRFDQLPLPPKLPSDERQRRRREAVSEILKRYAEDRRDLSPGLQVPTTAVLREFLLANGHEGASDKTLLKDMAALGSPSPRRHKRPRKAEKQLKLPDTGPE